MDSAFFYSLISVFLVSIISLVGIFALSIKTEKLKKIIIFLISFSAGVLFGDAFIHLLPEISEKGLAFSSSIYILCGIASFFVLEKIICWRHCHLPITKTHVHSFAYINLVGDSLHNFIDGIIIAGSYMVGLSIGFATTIAVIFHEIPQEIGDFGVLIHGGLKKKKAIMLNFLSALASFAGMIIAFLLSSLSNITSLIIPFTIGGFIYIAGSDLIPELHKETKISKSISQLAAFFAGIAVMAALLLLEI